MSERPMTAVLNFSDFPKEIQEGTKQNKHKNKEEGGGE